MTSPAEQPPASPDDALRPRTDPDLTIAYLRQRLDTQIDETAETWALLQTVHQENQSLKAEIAKLRGTDDRPGRYPDV